MKNLLLLASILVITRSHSFSQGTWIQKNDFSKNVYQGVSFVIEDKAYIITNINKNGTNEVYEYLTASDNWIQRADFPGKGRNNGVAFSIKDKGYFGTGLADSGSTKIKLNDFYQYDPILDNWTKKADFLGEKRNNAVAFSIGETGYVGTGRGKSSLKDFYSYNHQSNTWQKIADLPNGNRISAIAFSINEKGYVGAGVNFDNNATFLPNNLYEYNPEVNKWIYKPYEGFQLSTYSSSIFVINGKGYLIGGTTNKNTWEYNPIDNTWKKINTFGLSQENNRTDAISFSVNNKGYLLSGSFLNKEFKTVLKKDLWEFTPDLVSATDRHLGDNNIFIVTLENGKFLFEGVKDNSEIIIKDINGRTLKNEMVSGENYILNLHDFPTGLYLFETSLYNITVRGKIIKF